MHILVADDDELCRELLRQLLRGFGHECVVVNDGTDAWRHLLAHGADVVISDWHMPGLNGVELCEHVRAQPEVTYPYFILLTARGDRGDVLTALRAGADDHLTKPLDFAQLEARLIVAQRVRALHLEILQTRQDMAAANRRLDEAAHRDALTGLGNRLRLAEDLGSIHGRFVREGNVYNIALFDIDHFKDYNDTYGHQAGDALLAETGRVLASELRQGDLAYRYGGEEFLLVLPNETVEAAATAAERIRNRVTAATAVADLAAGATMSGGVAGSVFGETIESVIGRADRALYRAKNGGRDRLLVDRERHLSSS
jgi:diguanylate cyclase (GGDEF)-like protein